MNGRRRPPAVAVTGIGLLTPAGIGVEANWSRLVAGRSCATADETLRDGPVRITCRVPGYDPDAELGGFRARQLDRFTQLAISAARAAAADAGWDPRAWEPARVGVVLGNSLGGAATFAAQHHVLQDEGAQRVSPLLIPSFMVNMVAGQVALDLGAQGPSQVVATACASGATAVGAARDLLRSGACDIVLAGACESALTPLVLAGLYRMGALARGGGEPADVMRPFDADRDGFVAAEGAAVLVLERLEDARARDARIRAVVRGYGAASDAYHSTAPHPQGRGIEEALRAALADAEVSGSEVDHVNAHGTSTKLNDVTEGRVLARVLGDRPVVTSTKGVTGHALAAAGAMEAAYTALALQRQCVPPTANLTRLDEELTIDVVHGTARPARLDVAVSTSLGFGGHNAALVLTAH
ncbi:beta-ketoacyl-[acyl-carrier-protein] synthase family protein [Streptomyces sediminimaris]|uniref:beta-ketoacyl-[acyl-carrier-protein] synthase family protein n=1 Tax=Streptomyces sediminimaris TaxID=3383721 RepID=UPI00399C350A